MKKIFSYIIGVILVVSSVIAVGHFVKPNTSSPISADEVVNYVEIPAECFYLTKEFAIDGQIGANKTLKTAYEEELVDTESNLANLPCYAILSLKLDDYIIQAGKYAGMSLGDFLKEHPNITLPNTITKDGSTQAIICGISYINQASQLTTNGYNTVYSDYENLTNLGNRGAFDMSVYYKKENKDYVWNEEKKTFDLKDGVVFDSITTSLVKGVKIPTAYKYISNMAFAFSNLERVEFAGNDVGKGYFGIQVFDRCLNLKTSNVSNSKNTIPSNINTKMPTGYKDIKNIYPSNIFSNTAIESVYISKNFTTINDYAFQNCEKLQTVEFESGSELIIINIGVFQNDIALGKMDLNQTKIGGIGDSAFSNTPKLKQITIPKSVASIGRGVFIISDEKYPVYYSTTFEDAVSGITYDSPRAIIFDGDRSTDSMQLETDLMFSNFDASKDYMKYSYCYYNKKSSDDTFANELAGIFNDNSAKNFFDHTTFKAKYTIDYEIVSDGNKISIESAEIDLSKLANTSNCPVSEYKLGDPLTIDNINGLGIDSYTYTETYKDENDKEVTKDITIDLKEAYNFEAWTCDIVNNGTKISNQSGISNQTKVYTDIVVRANYVIKKYDLTISGTNYVVKDVPHGYSYRWAMNNIPYDYSTDGDVLNYKRFVTGDLDPNDLGYVGLYTDSAYSTLLNYDAKITSDVTVYKRSCEIEDIFDFEVWPDGVTCTLSRIKENMSNIEQLYIPIVYKQYDIRRIGDRLFTNNKSLRRLYFNDDNDARGFSIGKYAFQGCTNLEYAELPACNITVDAYAFNNTKLTSITLLGSTEYKTRGSYEIDPTALPSSCDIIMDYESTNENKNKSQNINVTINIDGVETTYSVFPHHFIYLRDSIDKNGYVLAGYDTGNGNLFTGGYLHYKTLLNNVKMGNPSAQSSITYNAKIISKFNIVEDEETKRKTVNGWSEEYKEYVKSLNLTDTSSCYSVVDLPDGVSTVLANAFSNDEKIKKVLINRDLTSIEDNAFSNCVNLEIVDFSGYNNFALSIGKNSFYRCENLKSFGLVRDSIYVKIASIGDDAFEECSRLSTFYMSNDSTLTSIGEGAFNSTALTSITIPNSVAVIGKHAFANTKNLGKVVFNDGSNLNIIQDFAFINSGLSSINLEKTKINTVGENAFNGTKNLKTLNLKNSTNGSVNLSVNFITGSGVKTITIDSNFAFLGINVTAEMIFNGIDGANNLEKITIEGSTGNYQNYNNDGILYQKNGTDLILLFIPKAYTGKIVIPSAVKSIYTQGNLISSFKDLKKVTAIEMETDKENNIDLTDKDYVVFNGALYHIESVGGTNNAILCFVPNMKGDSFVVVNEINVKDINKDENIWKLSGISEYAFYSNQYIRALDFADDNNLESVPKLYSDSIEAIKISKNIKTMVVGNFIDLTNLKTIKVKDTINARNIAYTFSNGKDKDGHIISGNVATKENVFGDKNVVVIVPNEDIDVYSSFAEWSEMTVRSQLQITFVTSGGKDIAPMYIDFGKTVSADSLPNAEKVGFDFVGWYTDSALTQKYNPAVIYGDLTLYANYERHIYTYTYMVDSKTYYTEKVAYDGTPVGPETAPTKKGKIFVCWKTEDGVEYSLANNKGVSDMILKAEFKTDSKYITKIALISAGALVLLGVAITVIVKAVKKKSKSN